MNKDEEQYTQILDAILNSLKEIKGYKRNKAIKILALKKFDDKLSEYLEEYREIMLYLIAKGMVTGEIMYYVQQGKSVPTKIIDKIIDYLKKMINALREHDVCRLASIIIEDGLDILSEMKLFEKKKSD